MAADPKITDAAYTAAAVASVALRQEIVTFARVMACCERHGLTTAELCAATGLDAAYIGAVRDQAGDL
jgi:hypothetical protein